MADVVGLIASIITLAQTVVQGLSLANDLYKAPEELRSLQVGRRPF
jgi:hypothetical protein